MALKQIIYCSRPFGYNVAILDGILLDARRCNKRDGITGALICRQDIFLQLLEGPADKVEFAYERITKDDRHANVVKISDDQVDTRMFGEWDMLHDPAQSWLWSMKEVAEGALDRASPADVQAVFQTLSEKPRLAP